MTPALNRIYLGRAEQTLKSWPDNFVDAVVTDPPYGLGKEPDPRALLKDWLDHGYHEVGGAGFMGKEWDAFVPQPAFWAEVFRVMKPGAHLLAFSGTRTYDWMVLAIRMAGFEIRDQAQWLYGQGFPKSMNISKVIDKAAGVSRKKIGEAADFARDRAKRKRDKTHIKPNSNQGGHGYKDRWSASVTVPSTNHAKKWEGWGTSLKPANEPICIARKPISEPTVAANVLKWGTGALNIDASRIESQDDQLQEKYDSVQKAGARKNNIYGVDARDRAGAQPHEAGRWPANIFFDQYSAGLLDGKAPNSSLFFYVAKPDGGERNMGLEGESLAQRDASREVGAPGGDNPRNRGAAAVSNFHPTVKPVDLMAYLIKLVTPGGGVVLDPFMGSGTTAIAAARLGNPYLGCEMTPEYLALAEKRVAAETAQGRLL